MKIIFEILVAVVVLWLIAGKDIHACHRMHQILKIIEKECESQPKSKEIEDNVKYWENITEKLHKINLSGCPEDYQKAFLELSSAYDDFLQVMKDTLFFKQKYWDNCVSGAVELLAKTLFQGPIKPYKDVLDEQARLRNRYLKSKSNVEAKCDQLKKIEVKYENHPLNLWKYFK